MKSIIPVVIASVLSAVLSVGLYRYFETPREVILQDGAKAHFASFDDFLFSGNLQRKFISAAPTNFISSAEEVTPSVVNIKAIQGGDYNMFGSTIGASSGSGVIISPDGYIVTNNHVVEGATDIEITMNDKREYHEVKVVGTDPSTDLALLKIDAKSLPFVVFGNSDSIRVGEWVLAVGNPFNLESTVTAGIVSAKGRNINILEDQYSIESFIQTDAAVNPGNSGGALVNSNGELVGINTAIITRSGRYEGYSFAIPANLARKVISDIKEYGVVQRGFLGISIDDLSNEKARELGMSVASGVIINRVYQNGAASEAGLKNGDVIVGINGMKVKSKPELLEQVGRFRPGNTVNVDYFRGGRKFKADIVLKNKANTTALLASRKDGILDKLGLELRELTTDELHSVHTPGVKVISIERNSVIERTNMDPGFIITRINNQKVQTVEDVVDLLQQTKGKITLEGVYENYPGEYYYKFNG